MLNLAAGLRHPAVPAGAAARADLDRGGPARRSSTRRSTCSPARRRPARWSARPSTSPTRRARAAFLRRARCRAPATRWSSPRGWSSTWTTPRCSALARDLAAEAGIRWWMLDLLSPAHPRDDQQRDGGPPSGAGAREVRARERRRVLRGAGLARARREAAHPRGRAVPARAAVDARAVAIFPDPDPRRLGKARWSAVVRFERERASVERGLPIHAAGARAGQAGRSLLPSAWRAKRPSSRACTGSSLATASRRTACAGSRRTPAGSPRACSSRTGRTARPARRSGRPCSSSISRLVGARSSSAASSSPRSSTRVVGRDGVRRRRRSAAALEEVERAVACRRRGAAASSARPAPA